MSGTSAAGGDRRLGKVLERNLRRALERRDLGEAGELLEQLRAEAPRELVTLGFEVEVLMLAGRLDEAARAADQLVGMHPGSPRVHYLAGLVHYRRRDYPRAAASLRESAELHPHPRTERLLAKSLTQAGELDEAEPILLRLLDGNPHVARDLAWLHERRGQTERALRWVERFLERFPDDELAQAQRLRLSARSLEPDEVVAEVDSLRSLGEEVPESLLPSWASALVELGRIQELRDFVEKSAQSLSPRARQSLGWTCYKLELFDLAFSLWLETIDSQLGNFKLLNSLEAAADRCSRLDELARRYEELAERDPSLWGRVRRVQGRSARARRDAEPNGGG
ncbi:MAG TPA: tetratricopeptide repeat protein [Thermoanaerobaculia bacterium]|nr:tetratricopeptide repeat protein [Thermoanaerobaculia bacterium]